ncbi:MAG TPA: hypothetical protein VF145_06360 [Chitinophagaceae bacterium]
MATRKTSKHGEKNPLEWTVFAVSALLVAAVLGYLLYLSFTNRITTPNLVARYYHDPSTHQPFRYRVEIENTGGATAEDVIAEAVLLKDSSELEKAELQIMFSPKQSTREGWVIFRNDPSKADSILVKIVSYKKP